MPKRKTSLKPTNRPLSVGLIRILLVRNTFKLEIWFSNGTSYMKIKENIQNFSSCVLALSWSKRKLAKEPTIWNFLKGMLTSSPLTEKYWNTTSSIPQGNYYYVYKWRVCFCFNLLLNFALPLYISYFRCYALHFVWFLVFIFFLGNGHP
jgi:hypothetical protein